MTTELHEPPTDATRGELRTDGPHPPNHDVFVSYSTRDKPVADALVSRLEQANIRCWVAPRDVMPGMVWAEAIIEAISTSRLMVVVLSGAANESPQVIREVERAVASGAVVIPFRIESVEPTGAMAYYLAGEHWLDAMNPPLESHIAKLVTVAQALLDREPPAASATAMPREAVAAPDTVAVSAPPVVQPVTEPRARRGIRTQLLVAAGMLLVIGGAALAFAFASAQDPGTAATSTQPAAASVAPIATPTPLASGTTPAVVPTATPFVTPAPTPAGGAAGVETSVFDLAAGYCFGDTGQQLMTVMVVDCAQPHIYEVFALVYHEGGTDAAYPGDAVMSEYADNACRVPFPEYVGRDYLSSAYWITTISPSADTWATGDREIVCTLRMGQTGEEVTGSAQNSGQ